MHFCLQIHNTITYKITPITTGNRQYISKRITITTFYRNLIFQADTHFGNYLPYLEDLFISPIKKFNLQPHRPCISVVIYCFITITEVLRLINH